MSNQELDDKLYGILKELPESEISLALGLALLKIRRIIENEGSNNG